MLFRKKLEGGLNALTEKNHKDEGPERPPLKSSMEKGDLFAMIFSELITILPVVLLVLLVIVAVGYLFFFH